MFSTVGEPITIIIFRICLITLLTLLLRVSIAYGAVHYHKTLMSNTIMDTLTMMLNMTILDNVTCVTIFGVSFIPSNNNNSNGGFSYVQMNQSTGIPNVNNKEKVLFKTFNILGQEVNTDEVNNEIIIHLYTDGSSEKKYVSKLTD